MQKNFFLLKINYLNLTVYNKQVIGTTKFDKNI